MMWKLRIVKDGIEDYKIQFCHRFLGFRIWRDVSDYDYYCNYGRLSSLILSYLVPAPPLKFKTYVQAIDHAEYIRRILGRLGRKVKINHKLVESNEN